MIRREEQIGDCRLILGDCLEVMPGLEGYDAMITDPPYGLADKLVGGTWGKQYDGPSKVWDAKPPHASLFGLVPSIVWGGNYIGLPASRCWLVWVKRGSVPTMADCELAWTNIDANARIFEWSIAATHPERVGHPTQKPVAVMKWCLGFLPNARLILDPFMGSGTTLVAAALLRRAAIGIEMHEPYFDIACRRVEQAYRQADLFRDEPRPAPPFQEVLL